MHRICLSALLFSAPLLQADPLSQADREALIEKLDALRDNAREKALTKIGSAAAAFRAGMASDEAAVEAEALAFLKKYSLANHSPMCGNSIGQDRRFMVRYMPTLEAFFHYRNLDVSTLKELCKRWQPEVYKGFKKKSKHIQDFTNKCK